MTADEMMNVEEALTHIMTVNGCSRRAARRELWKAMREGKLPVTGLNTETGRRETIPVEWFRGGGTISNPATGERIGEEH